MDENKEVWRKYYQKSLTKKHAPRTELAIRLNQTSHHIAIDCGCGTGADIVFLAKKGYQVHGFDNNGEAVAICCERFSSDPLIDISESSFESYDYPRCGLIVANASLFFATPTQFIETWHTLTSSLVKGGVFAGDFMGVNDSWNNEYRNDINAFTRQQVLDLFSGFNVIELVERDEDGTTAIGKVKRWHTFSVLAVKADS
ncbi:trans-aconitate 2-methyltransferase [Agarivorans sp. 1_MG-2023]|uniref:class I SAM-dependent methyltransferase n=1 Tax=Agarivorans sp. 1_MG-2023 TaxID=3062634 RepID=UPI0026E33F75|nr:class I SAM-dependent methyltransferase [Agarivorans sp. 1_MG-2023]MDO6765216.1 class I SAM-dependent methyltransferase [Agarivorans sp. 1_MG-2023]